MSYESPITIIFEKMAASIAKRTAENTWEAVQRVCVDVDKDELRRALMYDRGQYEKGYSDGLKADKWISVYNAPEIEGYYIVCKRNEQETVVDVEFWRRAGNEGYWIGEGPGCEVTHWQFLPDPPKEG